MTTDHQSASRPPLAPDIFCPKCSYNLHGAPGEKCPECGHPLANLRSTECRIPWAHRKEKGRIRAYLRTVWLVTFRPLRFREEYAHNVRLGDAKRFVAITVMLVYLPLLFATIDLYRSTPISPVSHDAQNQFSLFSPQFDQPLWIEAAAEYWPTVIIHLAFILFLAAASVVPCYFFQPRSLDPQRQDTAAALSLYACAPLALYPVLLIVIGLVARVVDLDEWGLAYLLVSESWTQYGLLIAGGLSVLLWWWGLIRLMRRTMPLDHKRHVAVALLLPLVWTMLAVVFVVFVPLVVFYLLLFAVTVFS